MIEEPTDVIPALVLEGDLGAAASDWAPLFFFEQAPLFPVVALGACFTLISMIAVWAALGAESLVIRLVTLAMCVPLIALAVGAVGLTLKATNWRASWIQDRFQIGVHFDFLLWLTWMSLASLFLSSTLLMFRSSGYRLVRGRK